MNLLFGIYLCFIILCVLQTGVLSDEYDDRIKYCKNHLSPTFHEDAYYKSLQTKHGVKIQNNDNEDDLMFPSFIECFRYEFFNPLYLHEQEIFETVNTSSETFTQKLETVDPNVTKLIIFLTPNEFRKENETYYRHVYLDLSYLFNFKRLNELWITKHDDNTNRQYKLLKITKNGKTPPLKKLHISVPILKGFEQLSNFQALTLLELIFVTNFVKLCDVFDKDVQLRALSISSFNEIPSDTINITCNVFNSLMYLNNSLFLTSFYDSLAILNKARDLKILHYSMREYIKLKEVFLSALLPLHKLLYLKVTINYGKSELISRLPSKPQPTMAICDGFSQEWSGKPYPSPPDLFNQTSFCLKYICPGPTTLFNGCMQIDLDQVIDFECDPPYRIPLNPHLIEMDLSSDFNDPAGNGIRAKQVCVHPVPLKHFDLSANSMGTTESIQLAFNVGPIHGLEQIEWLNSGFNDIQFYNSTLFQSFPNMKNLILSGNCFTNNSLHDQCEFMPKLTALALAQSNIENLSELKLDKCEKLKYLDLSQNKLTKLAGKLFNDVATVNVLNLEGNHISLIEHSALLYLKKSLRYGFINLSNNRLLCICHTGTLAAISAIQEGKLQVIELNDLTCLDRKRHDLVYIKDVDIDELQDECYPTYLWHIFVAISTCLITLVINLLSYYLWRKRYHIKTFWYKTRNRKSTHNERAHYHCYISHSATDRFWVRDFLMGNLEDHYNFTLCIPERDFGLGREVDELYINMSRSQCVLLILSENYLNDHKCRFELAYAFEQRRRFGKRIYAVKLGLIRNRTIRQDVKAKELLDGNKFIEWPFESLDMDENMSQEQQRRREVFWCKLASRVYKSMSFEQSHKIN